VECIETSGKRTKILQKEKNSVIMGRGKDTMVSDYVINIQTNTNFHSKTQNDKQEDQSNKKVHKNQ